MGLSHPQSSEALVRKGHLTGLKLVVLVTFQSPVNINHWKLEQLQIQMEAAPFRSKGEQEGLLEKSSMAEIAGGLRGALEGSLGSSKGPWYRAYWRPSVGSVTWRRAQGGLSRFHGLAKWGYTKAPVGSKA